MKVLILLFFFAFSSWSHAGYQLRDLDLQDASTWEEFRSIIQKQEESEKLNGQAYMISGALLVLGGMVGYHNAHTSVEKLAYSVTQSLGVAGVGYGAFLSAVGSPPRRFYQTVEASQGLSAQNKNELVRNYVTYLKEDRSNEKMIKIVTHALVSAVNIYNGMREQGELRQGLIALGGIHALAAISISFQ